MKCEYASLTLISALMSFIVCRRHALSRTNEPPDPVEVAKSHGYFAESHTVTTPDGYILTLHRVVSPTVHLNSSPDPFILQHGLASNSAQWIAMGPKDSLAYILADKGFDVWMTNTRGNRYSRRHERLSPNQVEFWDFSWHEHGTIDMPVTIDYILHTTKHKQVLYAGHSMGTTMFFVMGSVLPEYNRKIRHMFALAPCAYMSHVRTPVRNSAPFIRSLTPFATPAVNGHIKTDSILLQITKEGVCRTIREPCAASVNEIFGPNPRSNRTVTLYSLRYYPDYISVRQAFHYAQLMGQDFTFRFFDYYEQNTAKYNAPEPPSYPVERITAPVTFFYAKNDYYAEIIDVEKFAQHLPNVRLLLIPDPNFNHLDFIHANCANEMVYTPMVNIIQEDRTRKMSLLK